MENIKNRLETVLEELRDTIIQLINASVIDNAKVLMDQYIKLSPNNEERYTLEAIIYMGEGSHEKAEEILQEGILIHPLSFDLLYNLGYIFEQKEEYLEAYHIYMKARYIAELEDQKKDIALALTNIKDKFAGTETAKDDNITTILKIGNLQITSSIKTTELLKRKKLLKMIEEHIDKDSLTVLEIGFNDGTISKNLNYYGYDVTAVDHRKERILHVIAKEWQDNLLNPEQKVARFYHDEINMEWIKSIPEFDTIIAIAEQGLDNFSICEKEKSEMLELLINKSKKQLFIRVSSEDLTNEFNKNDLKKIAKGYNMKLISYDEDEDGFEIYLIEKQSDIKGFTIPRYNNIMNSESTIIEVEINKCRDMYGAGYIGDFHHFVEALEEYKKYGKIDYQKSILKKYYDMFQPENMEEALFGLRGKVQKLRQGFIGYPWYWNENTQLIFVKKTGETRIGGNHHFGPNTEEFGENEFRRLISLYSYFKLHGYHPEMFSDGYISGYLLVKDTDYRFVITEGQHRIAVLAALGYETIKCRFTQSPVYPRIVNYKDIKKWPQVENKVYSRNLAQKVFNRFFEDGVGKDRMEY